MQNEADKKKGQVSELALGSNIDDGQDFDPRSDAENELGANDEDLAKNRGGKVPAKGAPGAQKP